MNVVYKRKETHMFRNYIVDYNEKGIAKHQVFQAPAMGMTPEKSAGMMIDYIRLNGWVPVNVVEIKGSFTIDELKNLAERPPEKGIECFIWYQDRPEAIKTLPQDIHRIKKYI
ncbi:MAG: hypothetical protein SOR93_09630 [Clostridiales Family XIII bacterium]|nr:hypothetical protein [Clostridia bacterium]MDY3011494.1 hypothetical protein [Clostridiales Family XIII bacterium]